MNDFILNNDNVKTYTWTSGGKEHIIKYHLSLKFRVIQLRNKRDDKII